MTLFSGMCNHMHMTHPEMRRVSTKENRGGGGSLQMYLVLCLASQDFVQGLKFVDQFFNKHVKQVLFRIVNTFTN